MLSTLCSTCRDNPWFDDGQFKQVSLIYLRNLFKLSVIIDSMCISLIGWRMQRSSRLQSTNFKLQHVQVRLKVIKLTKIASNEAHGTMQYRYRSAKTLLYNWNFHEYPEPKRVEYVKYYCLFSVSYPGYRRMERPLPNVSWHVKLHL